MEIPGVPALTPKPVPISTTCLTKIHDDNTSAHSQVHVCLSLFTVFCLRVTL